MGNYIYNMKTLFGLCAIVLAVSALKIDTPTVSGRQIAPTTVSGRKAASAAVSGRKTKPAKKKIDHARVAAHHAKKALHHSRAAKHSMKNASVNMKKYHEFKAKSKMLIKSARAAPKVATFLAVRAKRFRK